MGGECYVCLCFLSLADEFYCNWLLFIYTLVALNKEIYGQSQIAAHVNGDCHGLL